jgi:hypothetical protein
VTNPPPANHSSRTLSLLGRALFSVAVTAAVVIGMYLAFSWLVSLHH